MKKIILKLLVILCLTSVVFAGWDKDKPASSTSLRSSNPEILANWDALQTGIDSEHDFGSSTQTGSHTPGSARCFFQDAEPSTQIDGGSFAATDLGSLWFDTNSSPDNQFYVLTATTPTWTPVSTEIIATLLASNRVFAGTLGVTGDFAVNTNKFNVTAVSGNTAVAGTLDVTGNIDPTTYETTNGGFLDEDDMASDAADKVASQQSIKAYVDLDSTGSVMHDAEGGFTNADVDGTKTKVYTLYLTGTLGAGASTNVAHGLADVDKILSVSVMLFNDSVNKYYGVETHLGASGGNDYLYQVDGTNVAIVTVGANFQSNNYRIKLDYIL